MDEAASIVSLSQRLTDAIVQVEMQRSSLEEIILHLAQHASTLNGVAGVLTEATHAQGSVLEDLQRFVARSGAAAQLGAGLQPAASGLAAASASLAAASAGAPSALANGALAAAPSAQIEPAQRAASTSTPEARAPVAASACASAPVSETGADSGGSWGRARSTTMPVRAPVVEPDMSDEEGVEYVKGLTIKGPSQGGGCRGGAEQWGS